MTLEDAANVLIGEEEEGQTKYKSRHEYNNNKLHNCIRTDKVNTAGRKK